MPLEDDGPVARSSADMSRLGHRIAEARQRLDEHGTHAEPDHDELKARTDRVAGEIERD